MGNRIPELAAFEHQGVSPSTGLKRVLMYGKDSSGNYVEISVDASGGVGTPSSITSGKKAVTTSGTAETLVASSTPCSYVILSGDTDNGSVIVAGGSNVDATTNNQNGIVIIPGNQPIRIDIDDAVNLYVDADTSGGVCTYAIFS